MKEIFIQSINRRKFSSLGLLKIFGLIIFTIHILGNSGLQMFAYDNTNANQGKVFTNAKVDTSIPYWFQPMNSDNLNDWLGILPVHLQQYKNASQFLVIPAMGLITPIVELNPDSADYKKGISGKDFDYDKYLIDGPTIYPGTARIGEIGNTFLFGHSNYWVGKPGNFKTIFRLTYNIQKKDTILVFKKIDGTRKKYTYEVTQSRLVDETEVSVMMPDQDKKEITLSACRPIGTARQRRINRASLIGEDNLTYQVDTSAVKAPSYVQDKQQVLLQGVQNNQNLSEEAKDALALTYSSYIPGSGIQATQEYKPKKDSISKEAEKAVVTAIQTLLSIVKK